MMGSAYRHLTKVDLKALAVTPDTLYAQVRNALGGVMTMRENRIYMDGREVTFAECVIAANTHLAKAGGQQLGKNPQWHVSHPKSRKQPTSDNS